MQHSHHYIPTLQWSVSSWLAVLSSKDCFLLFIFCVKMSADALLQNRQGQFPFFSVMRADPRWTWKASCSSPEFNHVLYVFHYRNVLHVFHPSRKGADPFESLWNTGAHWHVETCAAATCCQSFRHSFYLRTTLTLSIFYCLVAFRCPSFFQSDVGRKAIIYLPRSCKCIQKQRLCNQARSVYKSM